MFDMRYISRLAVFATFVALLSTQSGCAVLFASPPQIKTLPGLVEHFKSCGLKVDKAEDVVYQAVHASDGVVLYIEGAKVEVYRYDPKKPMQKERLDEVAKTGHLRILTIPVKAVRNGNLIMLAYTRHPKIHDIIKAFKNY